jgi:hypothetical protein
MFIPIGGVILLALAGFIGTFVGAWMCLLWLNALWHGHQPDLTILVFALIMFGVWFPVLSRMLLRIRRMWHSL